MRGGSPARFFGRKPWSDIHFFAGNLAALAWIWAEDESGKLYEGMGTTWDNQESSLAKLTFGRRPPEEL